MNLSKSRLNIIGILVFIIFLFLIISRNNSDKVNNLITIITAVLGFLAIIYQLRMDHKIKRAEFIYSLNDTFSSDEDIKHIYMKLKASRTSEFIFSEEDGRKMGNYTMFFLILNYLEKQDLIEIQMIDSIFSNKFFIFCNNKYVQKYQLEYTELNYEIIDLYQKWYNYRVKKRSIELYPKDSFSKYKKFFTRKKNGTIIFDKKYANITYDTEEI